MVASTSMHPSTRPLSETARHVCVPAGIVASGWQSVEDRCERTFGQTFDQWQKDIGKLTLAKREGGLYAAAIGGVVLSIPRQTGKTYLIAWLVFALCTLVPDLTVVWTAHRTRTSDETFEKMKAMALRPKVQPFISGKPRTANGQQQIAFVNGSRILFGAREQGFGRGFDMVDILVLDEGQILTENAMTDMVPATNAAPNGLVIIMGTPPRPKDPGEVFAARRQDAIDGDPDTLYVELSAERGAKIIDWRQLEIANPSFPHRTSRTAILRMQKLLGSDINFYREAYGIWDDLSASASRLIPADAWSATATSETPMGARSLAVTFSFDGLRQSMAGAVRHDAGVHVELVGAHSGSAESGTSSLVEWLTEDPKKPERWRSLANIAIAGGGEAATLHDALHKAGVPKQMMHVMTTPQVLAGNAMMLDALRDRSLSHPAPTEGVVDALDASVAVCDQKMRPSGWSWKATTPDGDALPIESACMALWIAKTSRRAPVGERGSSPRGGRSSGHGRSAGRR